MIFPSGFRHFSALSVTFSGPISLPCPSHLADRFLPSFEVSPFARARTNDLPVADRCVGVWHVYVFEGISVLRNVKRAEHIREEVLRIRTFRAASATKCNLVFTPRSIPRS